MMNKNLYALTIERLKFEHMCEDEQEVKKLQAASEPKKELTAFEKFKLTPQYQEILRKAGKDPSLVG